MPLPANAITFNELTPEQQKQILAVDRGSPQSQPYHYVINADGTITQYLDNTGRDSESKIYKPLPAYTPPPPGTVAPAPNLAPTQDPQGIVAPGAIPLNDPSLAAYDLVGLNSFTYEGRQYDITGDGRFAVPHTGPTLDSGSAPDLTARLKPGYLPPQTTSTPQPSPTPAPAPIQTPQPGPQPTPQPTAATPPATSPAPEAAGLPPELQELYNQLETYLTELERRGQQINPNIEITPEQVAAFTAQAESEINPYYQGQLKLARESLLTNLGYSKDQVLRYEQGLQTQYGRNLRSLGESAAEQGFALSGIRQRQEGELATDTQRTLDASRANLAFQSGQAARQFAQQYGTSDLPQLDLGPAPVVSAGEAAFSLGSRSLPLYQLSPEVYDGLVGSQEFERRAAVQSRASELEGAERAKQAIEQQRQLVL